jgi:DNA-binding CsgD family transcriptional regulator
LNTHTTQPDVISAVRAAAGEVRRSRGDAEGVRAILDQSPLPMVMLDGDRRYVYANGPARLVFRMRLDELRAHVVDDLSSAAESRQLDDMWARFLDAGWVTGTYDTETPDGTRLEVAYYALANMLPGVHVGVFAPAGWRADELAPGEPDAGGTESPLTPRELEVLGLAAHGLSGPEIAEQLVLSPETVKNHFAHIRVKLGVRTRAAAVAKAIRLRMISSIGP